MRNKLTDLNNHLFAQLERLSDEDLSSEDLQKEIERSGALEDISKQVIDIHRLQLDGAKVLLKHGYKPDDISGLPGVSE